MKIQTFLGKVRDQQHCNLVTWHKCENDQNDRHGLCSVKIFLHKDLTKSKSYLSTCMKIINRTLKMCTVVPLLQERSSSTSTSASNAHVVCKTLRDQVWHVMKFTSLWRLLVDHLLVWIIKHVVNCLSSNSTNIFLMYMTAWEE